MLFEEDEHQEIEDIEADSLEIQITHSCGHEGWLTAWGSEEDQQRFIDQRRQTMCTNCWKIKKAQELLELSDILPKLIGTDKQVKWAEEVRQKRYDEFGFYKGDIVEFCRANSIPDDLMQRWLLVLDKGWKGVLRTRKSKFWIEKLRPFHAQEIVLHFIACSDRLSSEYLDVRSKAARLVEDKKRCRMLAPTLQYSLALGSDRTKLNRKRGLRELARAMAKLGKPNLGDHVVNESTDNP